MKAKELIEILQQNPEADVVFSSYCSEIEEICFDETNCKLVSSNFKFDNSFFKYNPNYISMGSSISYDIVKEDCFVLYPTNIGK